MDETCELCKWWKREAGQCQLHPPTVHVIDDGDNGQVAISTRPTTEQYDTCASFKQGDDAERIPGLVEASIELMSNIIKPIKVPGGKVAMYACRVCGGNGDSPPEIAHVDCSVAKWSKALMG